MLRPICAMIFLILSSGCDKNHRHQTSFRAFEREVSPPLHTQPIRKETAIPERNLENLEHGKELFRTYCSACHGLSGRGNGIVTLRGLTSPEDLSSQHLLKKDRRYMFDVMTEGSGRMISLKSKLTEEERWLIADFVKALQLSRKFPAKELNLKDRRQLP